MNATPGGAKGDSGCQDDNCSAAEALPLSRGGPTFVASFPDSRTCEVGKIPTERKEEGSCDADCL
jgi:hypothetical protein